MVLFFCSETSFSYDFWYVFIFPMRISQTQLGINHSTDSRNNTIIDISFIVNGKRNKIKFLIKYIL